MSTLPNFPGQSHYHAINTNENRRKYGMRVHIDEHMSGPELREFVASNIDHIQEIVQQNAVLQIYTRQQPSKKVTGPGSNEPNSNADLLSKGNTILCDPLELLEFYAERFGTSAVPQDPIERYLFAKKIAEIKKRKQKTTHKSKRRRTDMISFLSHRHRHGAMVFFGNAVVHDNAHSWNNTRNLQGHTHPSEKMVGILGIGKHKERISHGQTGETDFLATMTSTAKTWQMHQVLSEQSQKDGS